MNAPSLLPSDWQIPGNFRERMGDEVGRQRVMQNEGQLLLVLHAPPTAGEEERVGRFLWRDADGAWTASWEAGGPQALFELLKEYDAAIDTLDEAEVAATDSQDYFQVLSDLTPLARAMRNLYEVLQEARQKEKGDRRLILARDRAYVLHRRAELLEADARNALDFAVARKAEEHAASSYQMAAAAHRLNLMVAFFFPIATLTAIFSTNLRHGLGRLDSETGPLPLILLVLGGLALGVFLTLFIRRPVAPQSNSSSSMTKRSK